MRKILYAEDDVQYGKRVANKLRSIGFEVIEVGSCKEAVNALAEQPDLYAVIWDGLLEDGMSYEGAIQHFAAIFKGPMIANSSSSFANDLMLKAGCRYTMPSNELNNAIRQESWVLKAYLAKLDVHPE